MSQNTQNAAPDVNVLKIVAKRMGASDDELELIENAESAQFLITFLKENSKPTEKKDTVNEKPKPTLNKASGTPPDKIIPAGAIPPLPDEDKLRQNQTTDKGLVNEEKWFLAHNDAPQEGMRAIPLMIRKNGLWEVV